MTTKDGANSYAVKLADDAEDDQRKFFLSVGSLLIVESGERGCFDRWFGKMEKGSFRAGILSLTATAIGGGNLFL